MIALLLAVLSVGLWRYRAEKRATGNLVLTSPGVSSTYLTVVPGNKGRCWLSGRRWSTLRRSDTRPQRPTFDYFVSLPKKEKNDKPIFLLRSKVKGVHLFVPCEKVDDWDLPFLNEELAKELPQSSLCHMKWTTLFFERRYAGFYLQVKLPFDLRKKLGGPESRRAIVEFNEEGEGIAVCTRLQWPAAYFRKAVSDGRFPTVYKPKNHLLWLLHSFCPPVRSCYIMEQNPRFRLLPLPIPFSLKDILIALFGPKLTLAEFRDKRTNSRDYRNRKRTKDFHDLVNENKREKLLANFKTYRLIVKTAYRQYLTFDKREKELDTLWRKHLNDNLLVALQGGK